jgi:hypothetical protein
VENKKMKKTSIILICLSLFLSQKAYALTSDSTFQFKLKYISNSEKTLKVLYEKDTIPKKEFNVGSDNQLQSQKDTLGVDILPDDEFKARVKKSDKDLSLSLLMVFLGILTLFSASFLGSLAFVGLFGFFIAGAVFSIRGFKFSRSKALNFILLFLQTLIILIGLGLFIGTLFS